MNREEAIAIIRKEYLCVDRDCDIERNCGKCDLMMPSKEPILKAYKTAIQALEQEPCEDADVKLIHTQGLDEGIRCAMCTNLMANHRGCDGACVVNEIMYKKVLDVIRKQIVDKAVYELPPVNPQENERSCVTCEWSKDGHSAGTEECHLCMWESQYKPKIGHWIKYCIPRCGEQHYKCTSCGYYINFGQWGELYTKEFKYCPNCGVKMVEPQESEGV